MRPRNRAAAFEPNRARTAPPDGASFETVILPHLDAAHNLARWIVGDPALAEDVVQDAVLRALGHFDAWRGGDPRAWLLRILRNTAYDALAARRRRAADSLDFDAEGEPSLPIADPGADPEAALSHQQRLERLTSALAALPVDLRECLVLHEFESLSYKEIAEITGVAIGTVMSRLWRARKALLPPEGLVR